MLNNAVKCSIAGSDASKIVLYTWVGGERAGDANPGLRDTGGLSHFLLKNLLSTNFNVLVLFQPTTPMAFRIQSMVETLAFF